MRVEIDAFSRLFLTRGEGEGKTVALCERGHNSLDIRALPVGERREHKKASATEERNPSVRLPRILCLCGLVCLLGVYLSFAQLPRERARRNVKESE